MRRVIVAVLGLVVVLLGALWVVLHVFFVSPCDNDVINETRSPDSKYSAVVFERGCGATTPNEWIVLVKESKAKFDPDNYQSWVFFSKNDPRVVIRWPDPKHLVIRSDQPDESHLPAASWGDVRIAREFLH